MQEELSLLIKKIKQWIKDNKILDVILFGSSVRGKSKPNDIDLCIIIKDSDEKKSLDLVDSLGKLTDGFKFKVHINILASGSFVSGNSLAKTLLSEGHSIKKNKVFLSVFGLESKSLFNYTLKNFSPSKRVQFHYLLRGRYGSKGILKENNAKILGTGSILVPIQNEDLLKEIFDRWSIKYRIDRIFTG